MAYIEKRSGIYRVQIRLKGYPTQSATFFKLSEAKLWAQSTESAIRERRYFPVNEAKRHTLTDLIDRYIKDVLPHKSPSCVVIQTLQFTWWKSTLGPYALADITPAMIAEQCDVLARTRKSSTVRRYLAALSHAFTIVVTDWQWIKDSPMRKVRKPQEPRGRVRFLSDDERHRLLAACKASRNRSLYTVVILALSTGARKRELLSLTWQDINLHRGTITLNETKNGEIRTLPRTGIALDLMRQHAKVRRLDTALVFPDPTGKQPGCIREAWGCAVQRARIEDFRFHDLRHSAVSYLAMNGASLMEIAEILGHKTLAMVKRYAHLSESHTRSVVARMNQAVFG